MANKETATGPRVNEGKWGKPGACLVERKTCCENSNAAAKTIPSHMCTRDSEVCEDCYIVECGACGMRCGCDI